MKFRVFGGLDAPDWVLAGIYTLSKLSSTSIEVLAAQIIHQILGESFDYEKALSSADDPSVDVKTSIATLHFLINSAAKYNLDDEALSKEAQQLGLLTEQSNAFCILYKKKKNELQAKLLEQCPQVPPISLTGWQIDSEQVVLRLNQQPKVSKHKNEINVSLNRETLQVLLKELKFARSLME